MYGGIKTLSSVDYLLCGIHINMGGLDTHKHTHTHTHFSVVSLSP